MQTTWLKTVCIAAILAGSPALAQAQPAPANK